MEIYCHPVANGTYDFSGACSSTRPPVPWIPSSPSCSESPVPDCDSTSTLQYASCLPDWLAGWLAASAIQHSFYFVLAFPFRPVPYLARCMCSCSPCWSLKASNVLSPHSTAFFFNTSIYSSFSLYPKNTKKNKRRARELCKKVPIHSFTKRSTSTKLQPRVRIRNPGQYPLPISQQWRCSPLTRV